MTKTTLLSVIMMGELAAPILYNGTVPNVNVNLIPDPFPPLLLLTPFQPQIRILRPQDQLYVLIRNGLMINGVTTKITFLHVIMMVEHVVLILCNGNYRNYGIHVMFTGWGTITVPHTVVERDSLCSPPCTLMTF